jgi:hypothetical protein
MKLNIDLVPRQVQYKNLRTFLGHKWTALSKQIRKEANGICQTCGCKSEKLEAHELWHYDDEKMTQTLAEIRAVCFTCHRCYHLGHSIVIKKMQPSYLMQYIAKVNECSLEEATMIFKNAFEVWKTRSHPMKVWEQVIPKERYEVRSHR